MCTPPGGISNSGRTIRSDSASASTEAEEIADADIGLSWLPDDTWSLGKCGLKVLQYMAAGLPVVANPVGMNREMVIHGETGFLASTREEWATAVTRLARDPQLRQQMGAAGRQFVERHYSVQRWAPVFAELIDRLPQGQVSTSKKSSKRKGRAARPVAPAAEEQLL